MTYFDLPTFMFMTDTCLWLTHFDLTEQIPSRQAAETRAWLYCHRWWRRQRQRRNGRRGTKTQTRQEKKQKRSTPSRAWGSERCPQTAHKPGRDLIFLSKVSLIVIRNSKLSSALTFEISGQGISCATHCNTLQHTATHCNVRRGKAARCCELTLQNYRKIAREAHSAFTWWSRCLFWWWVLRLALHTLCRRGPPRGVQSYM